MIQDFNPVQCISSSNLLPLDLEVVVPDEKNSVGTTSTSSFDLPIPDELPTVEEHLLNLAGGD